MLFLVGATLLFYRLPNALKEELSVGPQGPRFRGWCGMYVNTAEVAWGQVAEVRVT